MADENNLVRPDGGRFRVIEAELAAAEAVEATCRPKPLCAGERKVNSLDFDQPTSESSTVFVRFGKICVVLALVTTLGAHWALLQTVAWTTMLANNLQSNSFHDAVTKTFDGNHPCPLCQAIAAGKKSEQKSEFTLKIQKLEFPPAKGNFVLITPSRFQLLPQANAFAAALLHPPATPPPRFFFI
jgi:hypothetical protein